MKLKQDILEIAHYDGLLQFKLSRGGHSIDDNQLSISIETKAVNNKQFPDCALICSVGHAIAEPLRAGMIFTAEGGVEANHEVMPLASAYFGFHVDRVTVTWTVLSISEDNAVFELKAIHDDVNYYDKRAKRTPTHGVFKLKSTSRSKLWIPSWPS